jgi:hypothetical protein
VKEKTFRNFGISIISIFFILMGTLFFLFSQKVNNKELRKFTKEYLESVFPKGKIKLNKFNIKFGSKLKLKTNFLTVQYGEKLLLRDQDISIEIPLLAFLTKNRKINIIFNSPEFFHYGSGKESLWRKAMGKEFSYKGSKTIKLPQYLVNNSYNIRFNNSVFNSLSKKSEKRVFKVDKFIIKDLGQGRSAAYELLTKIDSKNGQSFFNADFLAIGDFDLSEIDQSNQLSSKMHLKMSNIKSSVGQFSDLNSDMKLVYKLEGPSLNGEVKARSDNNNLEARFLWKEGEIEFSKVLMNLFVGDFKKMNRYKELAFNGGDSLLEFTGKILFKKNKVLPDFRYRLTSNISIPINEKEAQLGIQGSLQGKQTAFNLSLGYEQGKLLANMTADFDLNSNKPLHERAKKVEGRLQIEGFELDREYINSLLFQTENFRGTDKLFLLPRSKITLNWKDILFKDKKFKGKINIISGKDFITTKSDGKLSYGDGSLSLYSKTNFYHNAIDTKFNLSLNLLDYSMLSCFFPEKFFFAEGYFSGRAKGGFSLGDVNNYSIELNTRAKEGRLLFIDYKKYISDIHALFSKVENEKIEKYDGSFSTLKLRGAFSDQKSKISNSTMIDKASGLSYKLSGTYFNDNNKDKKSKLYLDYMDEYGIKKFLNLKKKKLSLLLEGKGTDLKFNKKYSIKKLGRKK